MKKILHLLVIISLILTTGCAGHLVKHQPMNEIALNAEKKDTLAVVYAETFFQERYMGPQMFAEIGFIVGGVLGALVLTPMEVDQYNKARLGSSDFEKKLDEFDIQPYFYEQLTQNLYSPFEITFVSDSETTSQLIASFKQKPSDKEEFPIFPDYKNVMALKLAYGIGARAGGEQLGFTKSYRPFIRLLARMKDAQTNEILWQEAILVFGEKNYRGSDADPENVPRDELITAFKSLTEQTIAMLSKSLAGQKLDEMPILVYEDAGDFSL